MNYDLDSFLNAIVLLLDTKPDVIPTYQSEIPDLTSVLIRALCAHK